MAQQNRIIFGTARWGSEGMEEDKCRETLDVLKSKGVTQLDTAQLYGNGASESMLGKLGVLDKDFTVDTKWLGGWLGKAWATHEKVVESAKESLEKLGVDKEKGKVVDIFYIHSPDTNVKFEDTLKGVNNVYKQGGFKRFGLSNYSVGQVKEVISICEKNGYVMPTVYQGNYNAVSRKAEDELFPLLRKHNIAFYAYSPIGGGFLTKDRKFIEDAQGRFSGEAVGGIYKKMYNQPKFLNLLDEWATLAKKEGISQAELAFRWVNYHSALNPKYGDGVIFGASKNEQIVQTAGYLRSGPLGKDTAKIIDELWDTIKDDAFMDNFEAAFGKST